MNTCRRCGLVHERNGRPTCVAHTKTGFCKKFPVHGATVCATHGASVKRVRAAADRRVAESEATKILEIAGTYESVEDPFTALADLAGEIVAVKEALREKVEILPTLEDVGAERYATQLHVLMQAYERFLTHSARVLTDMSRLDLTDRIARMHAAVDAATAGLVESALSQALAHSALTEPQRADVLREFGARLRGEKVPAPALEA
jgi:plasmid stability protein